MAYNRIKRWIGERAGWVAGSLFVISLILYTFAYLIEKGFASLSLGTILAAIATAILLASVSVTIEQYIKTNLSEHELDMMQVCRDFGIQAIQERIVERGEFAGLPDLLEECRAEVLIVAYAADNFIEKKREWIVQSLGRGIKVGLLILHPDNLEQPKETQGLNFAPQTQKTLNYCEKLRKSKTPGIENFIVKGYAGHLYFTGIFVDRYITEPPKKKVKYGRACVQLKANYKSQHKGILLTFSSKSRQLEFYIDSCRQLWKRSEILVNCSQKDGETGSGK